MNIGIVTIGQGRRGWMTEHCFNLDQALCLRMTDKDIEHLFEGKLQPAFLVENAGKDFVGDALAVDEHAVTIEDQQIEAIAHPGLFFGLVFVFVFLNDRGGE